MTGNSTDAHYYTRGVRFPRLIGQTHDGTRIPGGPYTMTQAIGGLAVFLGGQVLRPLWGGRGLLGDYLLLFLAVAGTVIGLRFVRTSGRDPFVAGVALLSIYRQPRHGRLGSRPLRVPRPHRVRGVPVIIATAGPAQDQVRLSPPNPAVTTPVSPIHLSPDPAGRPSPSTESIPASPATTAVRQAPDPAFTKAPAPAPPAAQSAPMVLSGVGQLLAAAGARNARPRTLPPPSERSPGA